MAELRLAPIDNSHLDQLVAIHQHAFEESAITAFGTGAIRRYYEWLLHGPHDARVIGAWDGATLVGFCAGGVFRGAMNGFLRKHRRYLALHVLTHPRLLLSELIRGRIRTAMQITVRYSRARRPMPAADKPPFGILAIATDPRARRHGAGKALMAEAETRARAGDFERMVLTVHPDNANAIAFYERLGWTRYGTRPWSGTMEKRLG